MQTNAVCDRCMFSIAVSQPFVLARHETTYGGATSHDNEHLWIFCDRETGEALLYRVIVAAMCCAMFRSERGVGFARIEDAQPQQC